MTSRTHHFPEVALLITHYNRPKSLSRLLQLFVNYGISFGEIIVSDDHSDPGNLAELLRLQKTFQYQLITSEVNRGLADNINKGQRAVSLPYTLYIQEDFVPKVDFATNFRDGLSCMIADDSIDIIRYYGYFPYPYTKVYDGSFLEMRFKWYYYGYMKFYQYSDMPHLRKSSFLEKFGLYTAGNNSDATEYAMCLSFLKKKGRGLIYKKINSNFDHANNDEEPSTADFRSSWKTSSNVFVRSLRWLYLQLKTCKFHWDYISMKIKAR
ncbi:glycosyltransferase family 2 protein [Olivibacter sitiensis]|uniref:glycosyltransferase family 2 protein n=1 Tax=Olivibacter sitiensis TaxID=376470 RepID=UPI0004849580|nr:glycosyltransferase [Olivibacter sitiensis]